MRLILSATAVIMVNVHMADREEFPGRRSHCKKKAIVDGEETAKLGVPCHA